LEHHFFFKIDISYENKQLLLKPVNKHSFLVVRHLEKDETEKVDNKEGNKIFVFPVKIAKLGRQRG